MISVTQYNSKLDAHITTDTKDATSTTKNTNYFLWVLPEENSSCWYCKKIAHGDIDKIVKGVTAPNITWSMISSLIIRKRSHLLIANKGNDTPHFFNQILISQWLLGFIHDRSGIVIKSTKHEFVCAFIRQTHPPIAIVYLFVTVNVSWPRRIIFDM